MRVLEPWESGARTGPHRRVLEIRRRSWGLVPRSRRVEPDPGHDPPEPAGEPLYEHRFLLCLAWVYVAGFCLWALVTVATDPGDSSKLIGFLLFSAPVVAITAVVVPRTSRSVRVDEDGLWVSRRPAVSATEIRAVVPLSMFAAGGAPTSRLGYLSWTTMYPVEGFSEVVDRSPVADVVGTPADWDGQNSGGAWMPGALVVTGRVEHGLVLAWALPTYRRAALVEALVAVADRVDEPHQKLRGLDVPSSETRRTIKRRFAR